MPAAAPVAPAVTSIVLVEDDPAYAEIMGEGLKDFWPGELHVANVARLSDARRELEGEATDCVLLDLSLPDGQGLDVLRSIVMAAPRTPVIVLTGRDEEDVLGAEALRLGAQDYLVKGRVTDEVVARSVRYAIERKRAELERAALEARYAQEAIVASALQRGLVPELPRVRGLELGARYLPSGAGGRVGGDWYDVIPTSDGIAVVIGDVAGHGVQAASLMGQLSTAARAYALEDADPGFVLPALDRLLRHFQPDEMATMVYVLIEEGGRRLRMASAGHPPGVVLRHDGPAELLSQGRGTVLGFGSETFPVAEESLSPGDTLVFYTDGLIERRGEDLELGFARLMAAVSDAGYLPAAELATHLVDRLAPAEDREDDVAVLAVRALS
jgi:serine phosphatase RsbU (regulator of sigma subunit)